MSNLESEYNSSRITSPSMFSAAADRLVRNAIGEYERTLGSGTSLRGKEIHQASTFDIGGSSRDVDRKETVQPSPKVLTKKQFEIAEIPSYEVLRAKRWRTRRRRFSDTDIFRRRTPILVNVRRTQKCVKGWKNILKKFMILTLTVVYMRLFPLAGQVPVEVLIERSCLKKIMWMKIPVYTLALYAKIFASRPFNG